MIYSYQDPLLQFSHTVDESPKDGDFQMHIHEQYEIFYFISGDATFLVEGNEYPMESGAIITLCTTESHRIRILSGEPYERYTLHFSPALLDAVDPGRLLLQPFHDHPLGQRNLYRPSEWNGEQPLQLLRAMCAGDKKEERRLAVLTHLYPLLALLRNQFENRQDPALPPSPAEEITAYINLHLFEELSLTSVSRHFFMSASQLGRLFKQAVGSSVWNYIVLKRLLAARSKIRAGVPISRAAQECGFRDYSSFYRAYLQKYKVSPKNDLLR